MNRSLLCHRKHIKYTVCKINKLSLISSCFMLWESVSRLTNRYRRVAMGKFVAYKLFGHIWGNSGKILFALSKNCLLLHLCNEQCITITFFQHRDLHKYTWCRDSLVQRSIINFCIVSADFFWSGHSCWKFVSKELHNCRPLTTRWSTVYAWRKQQDLYQRARYHKVGGPGGQGC